MIKVAILLHMHQPMYRDLVAGTVHMPWVRLHAAKDYSGLALLLREFPRIRLTVNWSGVLIEQLRRYIAGGWGDDLHYAASLGDPEKHRRYIVENFFHAQEQKMIATNPRYAELAGRRDRLNAQDLRVLQRLHNEAWIHPLWKGAYKVTDAESALAAHRGIMEQLPKMWADLAQAGQVEICATPMMHPIVPLLADPQSAREAMPHLPADALPAASPEDAAWHIREGRRVVGEFFGSEPVGMWLSECGVSDGALDALAAAGVKWTIVDQDVGEASLGGMPKERLYRPAGRNGLTVFIRDKTLSNLLSFNYQRWRVADAVENFVLALRSIGPGVVTVALDGENPWEHYEGNAVPFLRALFARLSNEPGIETVRFRDVATPQHEIPHVVAGSWIDRNFRVWAGHPEDWAAWKVLEKARKAVGSTPSLHAAQGSDWFWWYGEDFFTPLAGTFDQLFRTHVANAYRETGRRVPKELSRPIKRPAAGR